MRELPRAEGVPEEIPPRTKACIYQRASNEPGFDLKRELFRIAGVDLTDVPGISTITARTILMEAGGLTFSGFGMRLLSLLGWGSVWTNGSAAARYSARKLGG